MAGRIDSVACVLFDPPEPRLRHQTGYSEIYVDRLARGARRELGRDVDVYAFVDRIRLFGESVAQVQLAEPASYFSLLEPFRDNLGRCLVVGLDTVFVGPMDEIDALEPSIVVPRGPIQTQTVCNGAVLVDARGAQRIWNTYAADPEGARRGSTYGPIQSEMVFLQQLWETDGRSWGLFDDLVPGQVRSYKIHERTDDERIVYMHGTPKQHELAEDDPVRRAWER
jgi:hypothetical protein